MYLFSGTSVFPHNDGVPTPRDIGVSLGRIARFAGHTEHWYPVLAHVLVCAQNVEPQFMVHALLHDAPEVCCSDVPTPWKTEGAVQNEMILLERISVELGLEWPWTQEQHDAVNDIDSRVLSAETQALGYPGPTDWLKHEVEDQLVEDTIEQLAQAREYIEPERACSVFQTALAIALTAYNADTSSRQLAVGVE